MSQCPLGQHRFLHCCVLHLGVHVFAVLQAPGHLVASVHLRQVFMMFVIGSFMLQWLLEQHTFGISASARRFGSSFRIVV